MDSLREKQNSIERRRRIFAMLLSIGLHAPALTQTGGNVFSGLNADGGSLMGPDINRIVGINRNGVPRQQSPGSSMTNGAGNSYMTPGLVGPPNLAQGHFHQSKAYRASELKRQYVSPQN